MLRKDMYGFLAGTLLGNSWFQKRGNSYSISSENISLPLITLKKSVFDSFNHRDNKLEVRSYRYSKLAESNTKESYVLRCTSSKLKYFYNIMMINNKKVMTKRILDRLTPLGIAVWFMDDGYYLYTESNSTRRMFLCTDSYSEHEQHTAIKYFQEKWNIRCNIYWHKGSREREAKPRLRFGGKEVQKLTTLMFPYIIPEFWYKINVLYEREERIIPEFIETHRLLKARNIDLSMKI